MRARLWCLRHARCPPMVPAATTYVLRINRLQMEYRRRAEPVRPRHRARACRPPAPPARRGADHNNDGDPASPARGRPATQGRTGAGCSRVPETAARPDRPVGRIEGAGTVRSGCRNGKSAKGGGCGKRKPRAPGRHAVR